MVPLCCIFWGIRVWLQLYLLEGAPFVMAYQSYLISRFKIGHYQPWKGEKGCKRRSNAVNLKLGVGRWIQASWNVGSGPDDVRRWSCCTARDSRDKIRVREFGSCAKVSNQCLPVSFDKTRVNEHYRAKVCSPWAKPVCQTQKRKNE